MRRILFILLIAAPFCLNGQNKTIDPTVEVNRDFEGKLMEIAKGKLNTSIADSLSLFDIDFNYSFFNREYKDLYEFSPFPSVTLADEKKKEYKFMAKGGIGIPLSPEAAIFYTPVKDKENILSLGGEWDLFKEKDTKEQNFKAQGKYAHIFNWGETTFSAAFKGGSTTFNGGATALDNAETPLSHNFTQLSLNGKISPLPASETGKKFHWAFGLGYKMTKDESSAAVKENLGRVEGYIGPTFGRYSHLRANASLKVVDYNGLADYYYYGLFELIPQYKYEKGDLTIDLGVKLSGVSSIREEANKYHTFLLPAVNLTFVLKREKLWAYGVLDGENHLNPYSSLMEENRYLNPATAPALIYAGSTPLNAEIGLKGRSTDKFSYMVYAKYAIRKGMLQYAYDNNGGWYNAFNSSHNEFGAGGNFTAKLEKFLLGGEFNYASFDKGKNSTFTDGLPACGKPQFSGSINAMYNWRGGISAGLTCKGWGSYYAALWNELTCEKIEGNADLDINIQYAISPAASIYLRGENILGTPSANHPFTVGRGGCIIGGFIVKL